MRSYLLDDHLGLGSEYVAVEGKPLKIPADFHDTENQQMNIEELEL